jgi:hypothetical protein
VPLVVDEGHEPLGQLDGLLAVVGDAQDEQEVGPAHDAQADPPVGLHGGVDRRQRVGIHLDHVVEKADGQADDPLHLLPIDGPLAVLAPAGELGDVEGAEVTRFVRQQRLFTTRICGFDRPDLGRGVGRAGVDPVDEDHAGVAGAPGRADDALEHLARAEPAGDLPGVRVDEVVVLALGQSVHERVGGSHRDVEIGDPPVELAVDELEDVGVIDLQNPHVRSAAGSPLFYGFRRAVEDAEERHGAGGATAGGGDEVVFRAKTRERKTRAPTAVMAHEPVRHVRVLFWNRQIVNAADARRTDRGDGREEEIFLHQFFEEGWERTRTQGACDPLPG